MQRRKTAQKGAKGRKRAQKSASAKKYKQPGLKQPILRTPKEVVNYVPQINSVAIANSCANEMVKFSLSLEKFLANGRLRQYFASNCEWDGLVHSAQKHSGEC